jgi:hypothetical protein
MTKNNPPTYLEPKLSISLPTDILFFKPYEDSWKSKDSMTFQQETFPHSPLLKEGNIEKEQIEPTIKKSKPRKKSNPLTFLTSSRRRTLDR